MCYWYFFDNFSTLYFGICTFFLRYYAVGYCSLVVCVFEICRSRHLVVQVDGECNWPFQLSISDW